MARILKYKNETSREWMIWRKRLHSICFRELPRKQKNKKNLPRASATAVRYRFPSFMTQSCISLCRKKWRCSFETGTKTNMLLFHFWNMNWDSIFFAWSSEQIKRTQLKMWIFGWIRFLLARRSMALKNPPDSYGDPHVRNEEFTQKSMA